MPTTPKLGEAINTLIEAHLNALRVDISTMLEMNEGVGKTCEKLATPTSNISAFMNEIGAQDENLTELCREIREMEATTLRLEEAATILFDRVEDIEHRAEEE